MKEVKVIIWGLGAMGGGMADMLLKKKGVEIVGVADMGAKVGTSMYNYIKTERGDRPDVIISSAEDIICLLYTSRIPPSPRRGLWVAQPAAWYDLFNATEKYEFIIWYFLFF